MRWSLVIVLVVHHLYGATCQNNYIHAIEFLEVILKTLQVHFSRTLFIVLKHKVSVC